MPIKVYTQRKINLGSSYIILKTYITGNVKILSDNYFTNQIKPSEIWINGLNKSEIKNEYYIKWHKIKCKKIFVYDYFLIFWKYSQPY